MSKKSSNPRKIPKTQADVDRAYDRGVKDGSDANTVILVSVLLDKFAFAEKLPELWKNVGKLSQEIVEGRVSVADLRTVLREEYSYDA